MYLCWWLLPYQTTYHLLHRLSYWSDKVPIARILDPTAYIELESQLNPIISTTDHIDRCILNFLPYLTSANQCAWTSSISDTEHISSREGLKSQSEREKVGFFFFFFHCFGWEGCERKR